MYQNYPAIARRCLKEIDLRDLFYVGTHLLRHQLSVRKHEKSGIWRPSIVVAETSYECPENCLDCYVRPEDKKKSMRPEILERIISQCQEYKGIHAFIFLGGEPLIAKNIPSIAKTSRENPSMFFPIYTSGRYIAENGLPEELRTLHNIHYFVSLQGANQISNDRFRGGGAFERAKGAFIELRAAKKSYGASVMIRPETLDEMTDPSFLDFLSCMGVKTIYFMRQKGERELSQEQFRKAIESIKAHSRKYPIYFAFGAIDDSNLLKLGHPKIILNSDGIARIEKTNLEQDVGDIKTQSLVEIVDAVNSGSR